MLLVHVKVMNLMLLQILFLHEEVSGIIFGDKHTRLLSCFTGKVKLKYSGVCEMPAAMQGVFRMTVRLSSPSETWEQHTCPL